jgi:nucleotide-binding universal stress UspA family protein
MAKHFNARVALLNVFQPSAVWHGDLVSASIEAWVDVAELIKERKSALDAYMRADFQELPEVERVTAQGDAATVIADYAGSHGVDLIMMATHGYGPFRRLLLGSVTAKVLHDAACPVWTDTHTEAAFHGSGCRTVLCAVDMRQESIASIQWAADFARSYSAELILVHAIPSISAVMAPEESRFHSYLVETAHKFIDDLQMKAGTNARVRVEGGEIAETVCAAALEHRADLVVIGQGCMHQTLGRLRTNAYAIIRESPCPVVRI